MRKDGIEKSLYLRARQREKGQEEDRGSHFCKELQNGVGIQRLNLFSARKAGTTGISWSPMAYDKVLQERKMKVWIHEFSKRFVWILTRYTRIFGAKHMLCSWNRIRRLAEYFLGSMISIVYCS